MIAYRRSHYAANKAHDRAVSRAWKRDHAAAVSEYRHRYHATRYSTDPQFRQRTIARAVDWQRQNPGGPGAHGHRIRIQDVRRMLTEQDGRCFYCDASLGRKFHIERKTPLSRGGSNSRENICLSCASCNLRKNTKTAEEFLALRGA